MKASVGGGCGLVLSGRTPHGVRGLKVKFRFGFGRLSEVAPLTGCVD